ncbi:MAG: hypothetical protein PHI12_09240 [Dehalococcoidales bacterium]|nr:hypothetical protein [Dehalococcoidales bacterium]
MSEMKKVLIITYLPYATPRITGLAKYLPDFDWDPLIMTPHCFRRTDLELRLIETPYRDAFSLLRRILGLKPGEDDLRRQVKARFGVNSKKSLLDYILTAGGAILNYPDAERGWKSFAISEGSKIIENEGINAIISSSSPVTSHLIAKELKTRYKIPWVADLRDLWSQNHNYYYGPLRRLIDRRLELKTLAKADAIVTVSQPWAEKLSTLHKGKTVYAITSGFDPAEINIPPASLTPKFTITHTGSIYPGKQNFSKFFTALRDLISDGTIDRNNFEVRLYGPEQAWLTLEIREYRLGDIVRQYGMMSRKTAIAKQRESHLLLHLSWEGCEQAGYSYKLFEYLAARRPIISIGLGNDMTEELLNETKAGVHFSTLDDIKCELTKLYQEYSLSGEISYGGNESIICRYDHRVTAMKFVETLNRVA